MGRYFIELGYKGTAYAGFQVQQNANSIQAEVEKALAIFLKESISLTGSSRTDAGVHALQNYFHFDFEPQQKYNWPRDVYRLNAILPPDIVIKSIAEKEAGAHCRFDARCRRYEYSIYQLKDPFLADRSYYYPYKLDIDLLNQAASFIPEYSNFESFSKRNTQVKHYECEVFESYWQLRGREWLYTVSGNRFLRGMVKGLVGTMLRVGRGKMGLQEFRDIIESLDPRRVDFSVGSQGLTLVEVSFAAREE